eukprot:m.225234 g.225234  ORF g.225234 m.225234 type:complete len:230 (-) comp15955_c1_seq2:1907-2596(-)
MAPTEPIYFNDSYQFEGEATVDDIVDEEGVTSVILGKTLFHPQGGGQPSDVGEIVSGDVVFKVEKAAKREDGVIQHIGNFEGNSKFEKNAKVTMKVDEPTRRLHARLHSAGHLLDSAMKKVGRTDLIPSKGFHFSTGAYVEYIGAVEAGDREKLAEDLNTAINALISEKTDVQVEMTDGTRMVTMGGVSCPCGGTHVKNVGDIEVVKVTKVKKAKKNVRVSYEVSMQSL